MCKNKVDWLSTLFKGYKGKLTKEEEKKIESYVEENLISDSQQIQEFIRKEIGKTYSKSGVMIDVKNFV